MLNFALGMQFPLFLPILWLEVSLLADFWGSIVSPTPPSYRPKIIPPNHNIWLKPDTTLYHTTKTIFGKDQRMLATGYILYPTLSASLTHCIRQGVRIFMSMHAYHRVFSPSRADTLMYFPRNRGGFEQVVLLVFVLTFSMLCRIKIISFSSLKNGKII